MAAGRRQNECIKNYQKKIVAAGRRQNEKFVAAGRRQNECIKNCQKFVAAGRRHPYQLLQGGEDA